MAYRIDAQRSGWRRRLHVERLELRAAPGGLLAGAGLLGPSLVDLFGQTEPDAGQFASRSQVAASAGSDGTDDRFKKPFALADHTALLASEIQAAKLQQNWASLVQRSAATFHPTATHVASDWTALAMSLATSSAAAESSASASILKPSTLAEVTSPSLAGGGGSDETNGNSGDGTSAALGAPAESVAPGGAQADAGAIADEISATSAELAGTNTSADGLRLTDANGAATELALDENTMVIALATWCSASQNFKEVVSDPGALANIEGLQLVFAFGDEGGSGPGGVIDADFLNDLPGEVRFLADGSVQPGQFPSVFDAAAGRFDQHPIDAIQSWWLTKNGLEAPAASAGATGLALVDAQGHALDIRLDANTLVVGSATWCGATQKFVAALRTPEVAERLTGLRIVFAFDDEGGSGPGGVQNAEFLNDLPGEVAFLAAGSVRPERLPMAYNAATGQFDVSAVDALNAWASGTLVTGGTCGNKNLSSGSLAAPLLAPTGSALQNASGYQPQSVGADATTPRGAGGSVCVAMGDYNADDFVDAADYVLWRKTLGQTGVGLPADGSGNDEVDAADYTVWTEGYGQSCVVAAPGAFAITGPTGVQIDKPTMITWEPSEGATSYRFVLSQQPDTSFPLHNEVVTDTFKELPLQSGTYYVGVTAINESGETLATNAPFLLQVDLPPSNQLLFVTTNKYQVSATPNYPPVGLFHGVLAADFHCTSVAYNAGLLNDADVPWDFETIHYKAMITQATTDLIDRATMGQGVYYNTAGQVIATNRADVIAGDHLAPILSQNAGVITGVQPVWTGANADGTAAPSKCNNWTTTSGSVNAGNLNGGGTNWLFQGSVGCDTQQRFYCVGNAPDDWQQTLDFNDLVAGNDVPADYRNLPGLTFGSDWLVANDTLGGQLSVDGNYVTFTEPVSTLSWQKSLEFRVPALAAGPAGLTGLTVNVYRDAALVDSEVIPPLDPGQSRESTNVFLIPTGSGGTVSYEFVRMENPNAPGAPAPIDDMRLVVV